MDSDVPQMQLTFRGVNPAEVKYLPKKQGPIPQNIYKWSFQLKETSNLKMIL